MTLPSYPAYRDSGIPWLGRVPKGWSVKRIKLVTCSIEQGWSPQCEGAPVTSPEEWGVLKVGCVNGGRFNPAENKTLPSDLAPIPELGVRAGDVLVSRANTRELVGSAACVAADHLNLLLCDKLYRLRLDRDACRSEWLALYLGSAAARSQIELAASGASQSMVNIGQSTILDMPMPLPHPDEQVGILAFLACETTKIDSLVAEQERLVALLKEKRQAVISQAVTKGLDPHAPMKDSGVEWLGKVPAHWDVLAIKRLSPVQRGASPRPIDDPRYFDDDGEFAWVRIADVTASDGILRETTQRLSEFGSSLSVQVLPGELFISIAGSVGKPCIAGIKACIHDGFVYFPRLKIDRQFLFRIFEAGLCYAGLGKMGTQLNLNTDTIGAIKIALPPDSERPAILEFIQQTADQYTAFVAEAERAITLLKERRAALISAAVTGKIDVRGLVSPAEANAA